MADISPMMKQYFEIKNNHKNHIVFFRLGDFYEMFFDDAILASKELELTLTGRDCGQEERAPMCGIPYHSSETYIAKLIAKGYKVAICEQVENPSVAKGIVKREVVRVITPGTIIETGMLQDDKNNYIASVFFNNKSAGVSFADISTGIIHTTFIENIDIETAIISEFSKFSPSEAIFNSKLLDYKNITNFLKQNFSSQTSSVDIIDDDVFIQENIEKKLTHQFGENYNNVINSNIYEVMASITGLLDYLENTQKKGIQRINSVDNYTDKKIMNLSYTTRSNLELTQTMRSGNKKGTLLWVLDKTCTAMGKRLLRTFLEQPSLDLLTINERLNAVEELTVNSLLRGELIDNLSKIYDIERLLTKVVYGNATPREVYSFVTTIKQLPNIKNILLKLNSYKWKQLELKLDLLQDVYDLINNSLDETAPSNIKDGGFIKQGFNNEVDELRNIVNGGKSILTELENKLKEETGIAKLKIGYNRVFGYYIEVTNSYKNLVPDTFIRKQTLANAERYITDELKQLENKILGANERVIDLEKALYGELLENIAKQSTRIQETANVIAYSDVFCSFANVAVKNNYVKPKIDISDKLIIKEGRHPVIEQLLTDKMFVPNNAILDCKYNKLLIITGPNMAGKSTFMRQTALIVIMAQIGSFVPAESCEMGIVDCVFTRVGASDDLSKGQSTFMVEMQEVADILKNATNKSLILLDEIGRGTSTFDGMSIARSVVEYLVDENESCSCKTLFATHYHELTVLEQDLTGVQNYNIAVKKRGDDITFLRRIVKGPSDDSYGIQVAKLAGVPDKVIKRAKVVLKTLEKNAPDLKQSIKQLDFDFIEKENENKVPIETIEKLKDIDVETLTPLEALNVLYELKKTIN